MTTSKQQRGRVSMTSKQGGGAVKSVDKQMNLVLQTKWKSENIGTAAAVTRELSRHIWMNGKKFHVTIDCDTKTNRFEISRRVQLILRTDIRRLSMDGVDGVEVIGTFKARLIFQVLEPILSRKNRVDLSLKSVEKDEAWTSVVHWGEQTAERESA